MCAGVVQILTLHVKLYIAKPCGQSFQIRDRRGSALKLFADTAQLAYKLTGFADGIVSLRDFIHGGLQFLWDIGSAVFTEKAVRIGIIFEVGIKINMVKLHF